MYRQVLMLRQTPLKMFPIVEFWSLLRILRFVILWSLHGRLMVCKVSNSS